MVRGPRRQGRGIADLLRTEVRRVLREELLSFKQDVLTQVGEALSSDQASPGQPVQPAGSSGQQNSQGSNSAANGLQADQLPPKQQTALEQAILDVLVRQSSLLADSSGDAPHGASGSEAGDSSGQNSDGSEDGGQDGSQESPVLQRIAQLLGLSPQGGGSPPGPAASDPSSNGGGTSDPGQDGQANADVMTDLELNLLKLRQVVQESEALAQRMEEMIAAESSSQQQPT